MAEETIDTWSDKHMTEYDSDGGDKPTVSLSSRSIFILAADVPVAALSPTDTILVM